MTKFKKNIYMGASLLLSLLLISGCGASKDSNSKADAAESSAASESTAEPSQVQTAEEIQAMVDAIEPHKPENLGKVSIRKRNYQGIFLNTTVADSVSDEDVTDFIENNVLPNYTEEVDAPAAEGDTVNIDYVGKVDGVAFDGGTAENQTLVIGAGRYIPGFEEGIVGMKAGEVKDIDVTFPEEYSAELAGKDAVFTITLNSVQRQRELDDALAKELNPDCANKEEYIEFVKENLQFQAMSEAQGKLYDNAISAVIKNCGSVEPSEEAVEWRIDERIISENQLIMAAYGVDLGTYLSTFSTSYEAYRDLLREDCTDEAKHYLVTEAICDAEGFEATEENMNTWAQLNGVDMETVKAVYDDDEAKVRCRAWLAASYIAENAQVNYVSEEEFNKLNGED